MGYFFIFLFFIMFSMAKLLSKFRIEFADLIVIPDLQRKAQPATKEMFMEMIEPCRRKGQNNGREGGVDIRVLRKANGRTCNEPRQVV